MIHVVIPVFNRWNFTRACLDGLMKQTFHDYKVIVVDHGSTDGTAEMIKKHYPEVILLKGDSSMWWSAATNVGIRHALEGDAQYILTLNNDTTVEPGYLQALYNNVTSISEPCLVGSSAIESLSGKTLYLGEVMKWMGAYSVPYTDVWMNGNKPSLLEVSFFPGRGLLIPAEVFRRIGLFDEQDFPHYLADYEFTMRARKAGYRVFCSTQASVRVYPEESGAYRIKKEKNLRNYYQHIMGIKGGGNIPSFIKYALRYCPVYALPSFLVIGTLKRMLGYWVK